MGGLGTMMSHSRDEWPTRLFKMHGFGRVDVRWDPMRGCMAVTLARHSDGQPTTVALPEDYRSMTLETFRKWVDGVVEGISGPTDFPRIAFNNG